MTFGMTSQDAWLWTPSPMGPPRPITLDDIWLTLDDLEEEYRLGPPQHMDDGTVDYEAEGTAIPVTLSLADRRLPRSPRGKTAKEERRVTTERRRAAASDRLDDLDRIQMGGVSDGSPILTWRKVVDYVRSAELIEPLILDPAEPAI